MKPKFTTKFIAALSLLSVSAAAYALPANNNINPIQISKLSHQYEILGSNGYCIHSRPHMDPGFCDIWG